jgi:hypothetical protein
MDNGQKNAYVLGMCHPTSIILGVGSCPFIDLEAAESLRIDSGEFAYAFSFLSVQ